MERVCVGVTEKGKNVCIMNIACVCMCMCVRVYVCACVCVCVCMSLSLKDKRVFRRDRESLCIFVK
jgi:hypothetical protein